MSVTETTNALAEAIMKLTASLKDHPVSRSIAYHEASLDLARFNAAPDNPETAYALEKSAEDLLDELAITRHRETREHVVAKQAFDDVLRKRADDHRRARRPDEDAW